MSIGKNMRNTKELEIRKYYTLFYQIVLTSLYISIYFYDRKGIHPSECSSNPRYEWRLSWKKRNLILFLIKIQWRWKGKIQWGEPNFSETKGTTKRRIWLPKKWQVRKTTLGTESTANKSVPSRDAFTISWWLVLSLRIFLLHSVSHRCDKQDVREIPKYRWVVEYLRSTSWYEIW